MAREKLEAMPSGNGNERASSPFPGKTPEGVGPDIFGAGATPIEKLTRLSELARFEDLQDEEDSEEPLMHAATDSNKKHSITDPEQGERRGSARKFLPEDSPVNTIPSQMPLFVKSVGSPRDSIGSGSISSLTAHAVDSGSIS